MNWQPILAFLDEEKWIEARPIGRGTRRSGQDVLLGSGDMDPAELRSPRSARALLVLHRSRFEDYWEQGYRKFVGVQKKGMAYLINALWDSKVPLEALIDDRRLARDPDFGASLDAPSQQFVIVDDTVRSGGTVMDAVRSLKGLGANPMFRVYAIVSHEGGLRNLREEFPGELSIDPGKKVDDTEYKNQFGALLSPMLNEMISTLTNRCHHRMDFKVPEYRVGEVLRTILQALRNAGLATGFDRVVRNDTDCMTTAWTTIEDEPGPTLSQIFNEHAEGRRASPLGLRVFFQYENETLTCWLVILCPIDGRTGPPTKRHKLIEIEDTISRAILPVARESIATALGSQPNREAGWSNRGDFWNGSPPQAA